MHFFYEPVVFSIIFVLYWINRERRKYLKKRVGHNALLNIYHMSRNFSFMLKNNELVVKGDTRVMWRGAILYSFHFGIWELMPVALRNLGYALGIIVNRYHNNQKNFLTYLADKILYYFRSRNGIRVFFKDDTWEIVRFIKHGGVFGILVDGNTFYAKYEKAMRLAQICNVPLVPFAVYRKNGKGVLEIGCNLAKLVKQRPFDYLWAYKSRKGLNSL